MQFLCEQSDSYAISPIFAHFCHFLEEEEEEEEEEENRHPSGDFPCLIICQYFDDFLHFRQ